MTVTFRGPERAADTPTLEAIYRLRAAVWRETGDVAQAAFADGRWSDEHDAASTHWVIRDGEELVAAARLSVHERLADVPEAEEYAAAGVRLDGRIGRRTFTQTLPFLSVVLLSSSTTSWLPWAVNGRSCFMRLPREIRGAPRAQVRRIT